MKEKKNDTLTCRCGRQFSREQLRQPEDVVCGSCLFLYQMTGNLCFEREGDTVKPVIAPNMEEWHKLMG